MSILSGVPSKAVAKRGAASRAVLGWCLVSGFDGIRWPDNLRNSAAKSPLRRPQIKLGRGEKVLAYGMAYKRMKKGCMARQRLGYWSLRFRQIKSLSD